MLDAGTIAPFTSSPGRSWSDGCHIEGRWLRYTLRPGVDEKRDCYSEASVHHIFDTKPGDRFRRATAERSKMMRDRPEAAMPLADSSGTRPPTCKLTKRLAGLENVRIWEVLCRTHAFRPVPSFSGSAENAREFRPFWRKLLQGRVNRKEYEREVEVFGSSNGIRTDGLLVHARSSVNAEP